MAKRRWFPQNEVPGCANYGAAGLVAAGVFFGTLWLKSMLFPDPGTAIDPHLAWALVLAGVAYLLVLWGSRRIGISTTDDGLTEYFLPFGVRRVPWSTVTAVAVDEDVAVIDHARGQVRLAPPLADWLAIATLAQRHLGGESADAPAEAKPVPPRLVAEWLGIDGDSALVCATSLYRWLWPGLLLWLVPLRLTKGLDDPVPFVLLLICTAMIWMAGGVWHVVGFRRSRRIHQVRATADALEVTHSGGRRRLAWGAVASRRMVGVFNVVQTTEGDLWLPPGLSNEASLIRALDEATYARLAGQRLPRLTGDVPESALSRAELSVEAERGLSAAEGNEP